MLSASVKLGKLWTSVVYWRHENERVNSIICNTIIRTSVDFGIKWNVMCQIRMFTRDSKGISKLSRIQTILPYKIRCIKGSSEIPLLSLTCVLWPLLCVVKGSARVLLLLICIVCFCLYLNGDNGAAAVQQTFGCSCQGTPKKPETCPILPGIGCLIDNVIYRATVTRTDTNQVETYTGSTAQTMKGRYRNHTYDMRHPEANGTCLSRYVHKLKGMNAPYTIKWDIVKRAAPYNPITNICRLCVQEKHHILFHPEDASLNQRSEFFTICRHKEKHLLVKS